MSDKLKISIENNTALITINNPPANTWDLESLGFLEETINRPMVVKILEKRNQNS